LGSFSTDKSEAASGPFRLGPESRRSAFIAYEYMP
jgi:hypothetical protein